MDDRFQGSKCHETLFFAMVLKPLRLEILARTAPHLHMVIGWRLHLLTHHLATTSEPAGSRGNVILDVADLLDTWPVQSVSSVSCYPSILMY